MNEPFGNQQIVDPKKRKSIDQCQKVEEEDSEKSSGNSHSGNTESQNEIEDHGSDEEDSDNQENLKKNKDNSSEEEEEENSKNQENSEEQSKSSSDESEKQRNADEEFIFKQKKKRDRKQMRVFSTIRPQLDYEDYSKKESGGKYGQTRTSIPSLSNIQKVTKINPILKPEGESINKTGIQQLQTKLDQQQQGSYQSLSQQNLDLKGTYDVFKGALELTKKMKEENILKEKNSLAQSLGLINQGEINQYEQLLLMMIDEDLPVNFEREIDIDNHIVYFNRDTKQVLNEHPLINRFRKILYERKFKEDEVDLFKLENRKNIPMKFSHNSIIRYGKHDPTEKAASKFDTLKDVLTKPTNVKDAASTLAKHQKEFSISNSKRQMSKSIYKTKSISGKITKSIGGMGDITNKQKADPLPIFTPQVPVINPALMFTDIKIGTLNPKQEFVETRYKDLMNELALMKDTDTYRFMKERIYPIIEEGTNNNNNEEEDDPNNNGNNENKKDKEGNNKQNNNTGNNPDNKIQPSEVGVKNKQELQIPNTNIYHKVLINPQARVKRTDRKKKELNAQLIRAGLGFYIQGSMPSKIASSKNISNAISGIELSESSSVQGQSLAGFQDNNMENNYLNNHSNRDSVMNNDSQYLQQTPQQQQSPQIQPSQQQQQQTDTNQSQNDKNQNKQEMQKKDSQSSMKKLDLGSNRMKSGLSSSSMYQNENITPKSNLGDGELQDFPAPTTEFKQEKKSKQDIYQIDIYSVRCDKKNMIETIEKELIQATSYYESKYGRDLFIQQQIIEQQKSYMRANPEDVLMAMNFLNIQISESKLIWVARAFASMDLPDFWIEIYDEEEEQLVYVNQLTNFHFNVHPCVIFVQKMISQYKRKLEEENLREQQERYAFKKKSYLFTAELPKSVQFKQAVEIQLQSQQFQNKSQFNNPRLSSNQGSPANRRDSHYANQQLLGMSVQDDAIMIFENRIGRQYSVNLTKLSQKLDKINIFRADQTTVPLSNKLEYITNTLNNIRRKEARQVAPLNPYYDDIYFFIDTDQQENNEDKVESEDDLGKQRIINSLQDQQLQKGHRRQNSNCNDQHLVVLSNELGLNFPEDMHLLILVHEFIEQKESVHCEWRFRQSKKGKFYWYNKKDQSCQNKYPYLIQLKEIVTLFQHALMKDISKIKVNKKSIAYLKMFPNPKRDVLLKIKKESKDFVKQYLLNLIQMSSKPKPKGDEFLGEEEDDEMTSLPPSSEDEILTKSITEEKDYQANKPKKPLKFQSDCYQLKHAMDILRNKILTQEEIKEKLLFTWPLKFVYKEQPIADLNSTANNQKKERQSFLKEKKGSVMSITNLKENQKSALKKLKVVSKIVGMTRSSSQSSESITDLSRKSQTTIATIGGGGGAQLGSRSSIESAAISKQIVRPEALKRIQPPTSFQIIQNPNYFQGKAEQIKFQSDSSLHSNSSSSKSSSRSNSSQSSSDSFTSETEIRARFLAGSYGGGGEISPNQNLLRSLLPMKVPITDPVSLLEEQKKKDGENSKLSISSNSNQIDKDDGLKLSTDLAKKVDIMNLKEPLSNENNSENRKSLIGEKSGNEQTTATAAQSETQQSPAAIQNIGTELQKPKEKQYDELLESLQTQDFKKENFVAVKNHEHESFSKTIDSTQFNNESTQADISHEQSRISKNQGHKKTGSKGATTPKKNKSTLSTVHKKTASKSPMKDAKKTQDKKQAAIPQKNAQNTQQGSQTAAPNKLKLTKTLQEQPNNMIKNTQKQPNNTTTAGVATASKQPTELERLNKSVKFVMEPSKIIFEQNKILNSEDSSQQNQSEQANQQSVNKITEGVPLIQNNIKEDTVSQNDNNLINLGEQIDQINSTRKGKQETLGTESDVKQQETESINDNIKAKSSSNQQIDPAKGETIQSGDIKQLENIVDQVLLENKEETDNQISNFITNQQNQTNNLAAKDNLLNEESSQFNEFKKSDSQIIENSSNQTLKLIINTANEIPASRNSIIDLSKQPIPLITKLGISNSKGSSINSPSKLSPRRVSFIKKMEDTSKLDRQDDSPKSIFFRSGEDASFNGENRNIANERRVPIHKISSQRKSVVYVIPPKPTFIEEANANDKQKVKSSIEDSYKSLFENHFKDKAKQMNMFTPQTKLQQIDNPVTKYIQEELIIDELDDENFEEKEEMEDNDWLNSNQMKNFYMRQLNNKNIMSKRNNLLAPLNCSNIYQSIQGGVSNQQVQLADIDIPIVSKKKESTVLGYFPELRSQQTYINHQLRNQYYQATLQQQKLKNSTAFIDQFNSSFIQHQKDTTENSLQTLQNQNDKINPKKFMDSQSEKQPNNITKISTNSKQQDIKKVTAFPTLQLPTKQLVPRFSPKSRLIKTSSNMNFKPSRSFSPKSTGTNFYQNKNKNLSPLGEKSNQPVKTQAKEDVKRVSIVNHIAALKKAGSEFLESIPKKQSVLQVENSQDIQNYDRVINSATIIAGLKKGQGNLFKIQNNKIQQPLRYSELMKQELKQGGFKLNEESFKEQIENISKYQDDYSNFKIKQMLSDLLKKMPYVKLDFENKVSSKVFQYISQHPKNYNSYRIFQIEAQTHLELIKVKFLKKKLDLIAFDFIMTNLHIPKEAKKTIYDSELLKSRLFRKFRNFFKDIRVFLMSLDDIYQNLQRMIIDSKYEMRIMAKLFMVLESKFRQQLRKINKENIFEKIIVFYEKKKLQKQEELQDKEEEEDDDDEQSEVKKNQDEKLAEEIMLTDLESDPEDQNDLNPFSQQFTLVTSKVLNKILQDNKKKIRKRKKMMKRIEQGIADKADSDEEHEYADNLKQYKEDFLKKKIEEDDFDLQEYFLSQKFEKKKIIHIDQLRRQIEKENEKKLQKELKKKKKMMQEEEEDDDEDEEYDAFDGETEKKKRKSKDANASQKSFNSQSFGDEDNSSSFFSSDSESSNSDAKTDIQEETYRVDILLKIFEDPKYIFLFQQFLQSQEKIIQLEEQNEIWKLLTNQIGHIHTLFRDSVKRVEVFLDYGFSVADLELMIKRLKIDIQREGDLIWIAYFYCGFLLRYSSNKSNEILRAILDTKELNEYDSYFIELLDLNRIKRQFIMVDMNSKNKEDYLIHNQWFKFYSPKAGSLFFYNPYLKKKVATVSKQIALLQENFKAIEKYKFIEMIDFIMNKIKDEEEKDIAMQFNILLKNTPNNNTNNNTESTQQKKNILHYKNQSSIRGSIRGIIEQNPNLSNSISQFLSSIQKNTPKQSLS